MCSRFLICRWLSRTWKQSSSVYGAVLCLTPSPTFSLGALTFHLPVILLPPADHCKITLTPKLFTVTCWIISDVPKRAHPAIQLSMCKYMWSSPLHPELVWSLLPVSSGGEAARATDVLLTSMLSASSPFWVNVTSDSSLRCRRNKTIRKFKSTWNDYPPLQVAEGKFR